jgi:dTDP-4-amino-4,6-dideoxygalactose transaminase
MKIKFFKPMMTGKELVYIKDLLENRLDLSGDGKYTKLVHTFLEQRYKVSKALLTTSGTSALELAVRLLQLKAGDEIIAPSFTFSSTINAILMNAGLKVVFADIDPLTLNIDPSDIEKKITDRTKAIIVVHYAGVACDMDRIMKIAKKHNIKVIEDAAQAIDSKYKGKYLGTIGHLGCLSFHDTKNIVCGEGGALFINANDQEMLESAEILREKGTNRSKFFQGLVDKYTWVDIGSSYLPSDILAAFLLAQLESIDTIQSKRLAVYKRFVSLLKPLQEKYSFRIPGIPQYAEHNAHIFYVILESAEARKFVLNYLRSRDIAASFHYVPLHSAPQGNKLGYQEGDLPITEDLSARLLRLPLFPEMSKEEQSFVVDNFVDALKAYQATKITVTVGISAYNEEKNIQHILRDILNQNQDSWTLKEILVYCDGCSDDTKKKADALHSPLIKAVDDHKRKGKVGRVNQLFNDAKGDIVLIFDADLKLAHNQVISEVVNSFDDEDVQVVGGNTRPFKPNTFFEKAVYSTFQVFEESRKAMKGGNNIFGCNGGCIAVRNSFAQSINIPNVINEDDFIYFSCISRGYTFKHAPNAIVYYKLPKTLKDYLKQSFRSDPQAVTLNFSQYFGDLVDQEYHRPLSFYLKTVLKVLTKNPIGVAYIIAIKALCVPFYPLISKQYKLEWYTAASTK